MYERRNTRSDASSACVYNVSVCLLIAVTFVVATVLDAYSGPQHAAAGETDSNGNYTTTTNDSSTAPTSSMQPQSPSTSSRSVIAQHANRSSMSNRTPPSMTVATNESSSSRSIGGQLRKNRKSLFDTDATGDGSSSGNTVTNSAVKLFANVGRSRNKHNQQHTRYMYMHTPLQLYVHIYESHDMMYLLFSRSCCGPCTVMTISC
jgi:DNA mismatch repair ATPase MutL